MKNKIRVAVIEKDGITDKYLNSNDIIKWLESLEKEFMELPSNEVSKEIPLMISIMRSSIMEMIDE